MTGFVLPCVMGCTARSMERASISVLLGLKRGLSGLAAIACSAPFLGTFASMAAAVHWLQREPHWCSGGDCGGGIAEAFIPLILSLPVAVFACALWFYIACQTETLESEIRIQVLETLNMLAHVRRTGESGPC